MSGSADVLSILPIPPGTSAIRILPALEMVLAGRTGALLPVPDDDDRDRARLTSALRPGDPIDPEAALVVATSGSTGVPKGAMLSRGSLRASASATHERLGGPGSWLLALPAHHIAGLQVLLRSLAAGTEPVILDVTSGFDPAALPAAVASMTGTRRYTSLVPTQLVKALDHDDAVAALASLDAVLLGGAATPAPVLARARDSGISVVRTYGMSETCGGCVYDGVPLAGADVRIDGERIVLGGNMIALGYRGLPEHPAFAEAGWFRTDDAGELVDDVLRVTGRLDDAISSGGLTVVPQTVESALATHPDVVECAVVGVPDERLGERVVAAVVTRGSVTPEALRAHVAAALDERSAPRHFAVVSALPLRGPGKTDRSAVRALFASGGAV